MRNNQNTFITQILQAIFSHKLLIAGIFLLVVTSGMFVTFLITPKYESSMAILISREKVDSQVTTGDQGSGMVLPGISDEEFNSELAFLTSNEVISGAVLEMQNENYKPRAEKGAAADFRKTVKGKLKGWFEEEKEKITDLSTLSEIEKKEALEDEIERVSSNLEVVPAKKSRVINVTYTDIDPVRAKLILEHIYKKYAELHVELAEKPQVTEVFNKQTQNYKQNLNQATNAIKNFDTRNGISGAEVRVQRELLLKQFYDTQSQLNLARTEINEAEQKIDVLEKQIGEQPEQLQTSTVTKYVGALDQMKSEMVKLQQERTQLLQKYQPSSRFVREINERIFTLQKQMQEEKNAPPQEKSYGINDLKRRLISDLYNTKSTLAGLQKRKNDLTQYVEKYREDMKVLNQKSIERENLERNVSMNEEAYVLYDKKTRESEIGQTLQKSKLLNFSLVDPPYARSTAVNPKPKLNFIALSIVGLFLGFFCALFIDLANRKPLEDKISNKLELENRYNFPVLAVISEIKIVSGAEFKQQIRLKPVNRLLLEDENE